MTTQRYEYARLTIDPQTNRVMDCTFNLSDLQIVAGVTRLDDLLALMGRDGWQLAQDTHNVGEQRRQMLFQRALLAVA